MRDYSSYAFTLTAIAFAPLPFMIIGRLIPNKIKEHFILMAMDGIVEKRKVDDHNAVFIVCGRKIQELDYKIVEPDRKLNPVVAYFVYYIIKPLIPIPLSCFGVRKPYVSLGKSLMESSVLYVLVVTQIFIVAGIIQVSYKCISDPSLDCFDWEKGIRTDGDSLPLNCTILEANLLKNGNFVCYRYVYAYPDSWLYAAFYAFLAAKLIKLLFHISSAVMLWIIEKSCKISCKITYGYFLTSVGVRVVALSTFALIINYTYSFYDLNPKQHQINFLTAWRMFATAVCFVHYLCIIPWSDICKGERVEVLQEAFPL